MAGEEKNTLHDNAMGWIILGGVGVALFFLFWYFFEYQTKDVIRTIRLAEIRAVSVFVDDDYMVSISGQDIPLKPAMRDIEHMPREELTNGMIASISILALAPVKIPMMIVFALMGLWALFRGPGTEYRRKMGLDGLIAAQSGNFPYIAPFIKFNPSVMPPRPPGAPVPAELPPFAEALGPEEWVAYNQVPVPDGKLDREAAYIAFARQLGPRWQGPARLSPHKQILLAACCLKASRKRGDADAMLGRVACCWSQENGLSFKKDPKLLKEARAVLRDKKLAGSVLSKCNQHSFQTTAMLRALQTARQEGGVLAPAQFVWLRAYDRVLWYPLNNLGRQAFHMEALGAMAHFKAEKLTMRPIPKPKVDPAIDSIAGYVASARSRPIPQLDYKASSKRGIKKPKAGVMKPGGMPSAGQKPHQAKQGKKKR